MRASGIISVMRNTCNVNLDTHSRSPTRRFRTLIFKSLIKLRTVVFIEKLNIYIYSLLRIIIISLRNHCHTRTRLTFIDHV